MTPQQDHTRNIEVMLIDTKRRLNEAADRTDIREMGRLADQVASLSKLLEVAS